MNAVAGIRDRREAGWPLSSSLNVSRGSLVYIFRADVGLIKLRRGDTTKYRDREFLVKVEFPFLASD